MKVEISEDELRLLRLFRCLPPTKQSDVLVDVASKAIEECFPGKGIYDFMPDADGVRPIKKEDFHSEYSISHIIYCGIQETGDPEAYLLGSSHWDEEEAIPRFAEGAGKAALEQGSSSNYDKAFAREYIKDWRNEIVFACIRAKEEEDE